MKYTKKYLFSNEIAHLDTLHETIKVLFDGAVEDFNAYLPLKNESSAGWCPVLFASGEVELKIQALKCTNQRFFICHSDRIRSIEVKNRVDGLDNLEFFMDTTGEDPVFYSTNGFELVTDRDKEELYLKNHRGRSYLKASGIFPFGRLNWVPMVDLSFKPSSYLTLSRCSEATCDDGECLSWKEWCNGTFEVAFFLPYFLHQGYIIAAFCVLGFTML